MKLVIVESPSKSKKIYGILKHLYPKEKFQVTATVGHFRDLPKKKMGIDFKTWTPELVEHGKKEKDVAKKLVSEASKATAVYLATDPDREGDGIAACVKELLEENQVSVPIYRTAWTEITSKAIKKAIDNPGEIDQLSVDSQRARRMLDRTVGFIISPVLWKTVGRGLAAGRVQSCALKIIMDKEMDRRVFEPSTTYRVKAKIKGQDVYAYSDWFEDEAGAKALLEEVEQHKDKLKVTFNTEEELKKPWPPFRTSTMLQTGMKVTGKSSKEVMAAMQSLFQKGFISYHRTDSIKMSGACIADTREYLKNKKPDFLNKKARNYPAPKGAQAAHEAIRPTHMDMMASRLKLTGVQSQIYNLIWARTLCTQAIPATIEKQTMTFSLPGGAEVLQAKGVKVLENGWRSLALNLPIPQYEKLDPKKAYLYNLDTDDSTTEPPYRYTEISMIQKMEDTGIGRPSTYVQTIQTLKNHGYLRRFGKILRPSEKGEVVAKYLEKTFPGLLSTEFTAEMEASLDKIADGERTKNDVLDEYKDWLDPLVKAAKKVSVIAEDNCQECGGELEAWISDKRAEPALRCISCKKWYGFHVDKKTSKYGIFTPEPYEGKCEKCKKENLTTARSKYGNYVKCLECGAAQKAIYLD